MQTCIHAYAHYDHYSKIIINIKKKVLRPFLQILYSSLLHRKLQNFLHPNQS